MQVCIFVVVTDFVTHNSCWITEGRTLLQKVLTHLLFEKSNTEQSMIQKNVVTSLKNLLE